jgi:Uma2 family endonuclease
MANGAQLGWLINPDNRSVIIYRPGVEPEVRRDIDSVAGEGPVATFTLDLTFIWKPF